MIRNRVLSPTVSVLSVGSASPHDILERRVRGDLIMAQTVGPLVARQPPDS
jgi:hypothetical protein